MKTSISSFFLIGMLLVLPLKVMAVGEPETFSITLDDAQKAAEKNSNALQSAQYLLEAAKSQAVSASSSLYPRADLNGNYFYQTHVPTQTLGGSATNIGTNDNYSVGPVISYTLFDGGKTINNAKSAHLNAEAKEQDVLSQKRDLAYSVSLTYARVQLYATNLALTMDALKLAQNQSADIDLRFNVGTSSRLDQISAHKEMLNYKLLFHQAQNDLAAALQDLFALIDEKTKSSLTARPLPAGLESNLPKDVETPTLLIAVDPLDNTLTIESSQRDSLLPPGETTPQIKSLSLAAKSSEKTAQSQRGANWPQLNLSAESRTGYPDFISPTSYNNNIFSVGFSLPIWDWEQNSGLADKYLNEAKSQEKKKAQKFTDILRDNTKAADAITSLEDQQEISETASREAEEIARLTYQSYTAGKSTYLEVQSANLKLVQARVNTAEIEYALINRINEMKYLSGTPDR